MTNNFRSQWNQDQYLNDTYFKNKRNGFFVDIGASDGNTINNSYFFEKELGWNGICVEPITTTFNTLKKDRTAICINGCAYNINGQVDFTEITDYCEMLSGIENTYNDRHRARLNLEMQRFGGSKKTVSKNAFRLEGIFDIYNIKYVDFISIDTEGSELQVLEGINFDKVIIDIILIENNYPDEWENTHNFILSKGYRYDKRLGGDEVYVKIKNE